MKYISPQKGKVAENATGFPHIQYARESLFKTLVFQFFILNCN